MFKDGPSLPPFPLTDQERKVLYYLVRIRLWDGHAIPTNQSKKYAVGIVVDGKVPSLLGTYLPTSAVVTPTSASSTYVLPTSTSSTYLHCSTYSRYLVEVW